MRHRVAGRELSRTSEHRLALRRNLVIALFEHETISTTLIKAKEIKPFAEKLITLARKGTLAARRRAISILGGNKDILKEEGGEIIKSGTVVGKLFSELGPRYLDRAGGYTRIIKTSKRRLGDNGELVLLQLVGQMKGLEDTSASGKKKKKGASKQKPKTEPAAEKEAAAQA